MEERGQTGDADKTRFDFVNWRPVEDKRPAAGLGDVIAAVIRKTTGIKPCPGCERRKAWLNKKFPFRK